MQSLDTARPTSMYQPTNPRPQTLSIAVPTSLLSNAKRKLDLRTQLVGNLSRALAVFCVDEIVLFDDTPSAEHGINSNDNVNTNETTAFSNPAHFMAHLLSYQETPPFMRNRLFPMHPNLAMAGVLPSLDIPSHLRREDWCEYREGIVVRVTHQGSYVDCGLEQQRILHGTEIPVKTRVTLRLVDDDDGNNYNNGISQQAEAQAVAPDTPRTESGYYWGYNVRHASSLSAVFTESPYESGYDLSIGTSERGHALSTITAKLPQRWKHMILVFGGVAGLEDAAAHDPELGRVGVGRENVSELFDYWVDLCPGQGSRTIRTEEAVWMGLMGLRGVVEKRQEMD